MRDLTDIELRALLMANAARVQSECSPYSAIAGSNPYQPLDLDEIEAAAERLLELVGDARSRKQRLTVVK